MDDTADNIDNADDVDDADILDWETTDSRIDYSCPGFDIRMDDVRLPDGTETEFHYVDEPPAVVILPFTPDGDVVLVEEWRQAVGHVNRSLPVGGTEPEDDDLAAAARRELAEETGYEADSIDEFYVAEPANGIANSVHHYFVARGCEPTAEQRLDFNESIRPVTMEYEDLLAAVVDNEIRDGRTSLGVLQYELARP
ncbi:NUDIX hydrolase [Haloprofundus salilacus]|uniref:NUDIX hydrolase n=1 Tax=Haloprofundus salilacus TaxID=2876190 RepID=UPI001CCD5BEE|nr:NUDIX hydrolase [Haloprofundus salilacus]